MSDPDTTDHNAARLERIAALHLDVDQFMATDGFRAWLALMGRLHTYSLNNQMLIAMQCRDATMVMGYRKWQAQGRQVRKGEKAIKILAPMIRKAKEPDEDDGLYGFRVVNVFDVSQTDGDELPELNWEVRDIPLDAGLLPHLVDMFSEHVPIVFEPVSGAARGFYDPMSHRIVIDDTNPVFEQTMVLLHELGHCFDTKRASRTYAEGELIAESVKEVVCGRLGIVDPSDATVTYLASWGRGVKDLMDLAPRIVEIAEQIEVRLFPPAVTAAA